MTKRRPWYSGGVGVLALELGVTGLPCARAQSDGEPVEKVEEVVVTGSRTERPLSEAPVATTVVTNEEIEASGAETAADLLEEQPAVNLNQDFAGAGVGLSGLSADYTLVLVDGQRIPGRINGTNDLTRIPLEDVERVEIVRGSGSALYGSDAIGGVVNIITRRTKRPLEASARALYGRFNTLDTSARTGVRKGPLSARLSGGFHRADEYDLDKTNIATNGNTFDQFNLGALTGYALDEQATVSLTGDYFLRDQFGIDESATGAVFDRANRTETFNARLSPEIDLQKPNKLRLWLGYSFFRDQFDLDQRNASALDQFQDTREQLGQLGAQFDWLFGETHLLSIGAESETEKLSTERIATGIATRQRGAVYAQDEWSIAESVVLVPGARLDADTQFGGHLTPRIAFRLDPQKNVVLRGSYGLGFRAPNFRELYLRFQNPGVGYEVTGNPDLSPETSRSANLSVEVQPQKWLWLSLGAYRIDLENMILTEPVDTKSIPQRHQYQNVASAHTQGVDVVARVQPLSGLRLDASYSLLDARDEQLDRRLEGRPVHRATFAASWVFPTRSEVSVRSAVQGPRPFYRDRDGDGELERIDAKAFATLDLHLSQGLGEHVKLLVLAENLLDAGEPEFLPIKPFTIAGGIEASY